ncbi:MAG: YdcF family protein [Clostridia bacterium]|nr:YdcF family protein [Clostridia bacterium]
MSITVLTGGFSAACWILFWLLFRKDRSRYRNCYALSLALLSLFPLIISFSGDHRETVLIAIAFAFLISILIVPFFLIFNGVVTIRREGKHLSQMLSLLFGLAILAGEAIVWMGLDRVIRTGGRETLIPQAFLPVVCALFCVSVIYISLSFLLFMIYVVFLQIIPRKKDFDYVIIHGSGLLGGDRVPKLLQDRLDKAIEVYRSDPSPTILIPSGGQGPDEKIPEAEAMKRYLLSKGIPEKDIISENRSTTTLENLQFSKDILDGRKGRKYTALVTSNYHVYRALRYCRRIGLKCTGIGSHVAFYYWPSALIREYIAVHTEPKHALLLALGWLLSIAPVLDIIF